jgi:hypothetical protein
MDADAGLAEGALEGLYWSVGRDAAGRGTGVVADLVAPLSQRHGEDANQVFYGQKPYRAKQLSGDGRSMRMPRLILSGAIIRSIRQR